MPVRGRPDMQPRRRPPRLQPPARASKAPSDPAIRFRRDRSDRTHIYLWEGMLAFAKRQRQLSPIPAFVKRQRLLSLDQYEIVDIRTSRGVRRAMLFPKAILQEEFEANAPLREALRSSGSDCGRSGRSRKSGSHHEKKGRPVETAPKGTNHVNLLKSLNHEIQQLQSNPSGTYGKPRGFETN